jgi:hypothetical protein
LDQLTSGIVDVGIQNEDGTLQYHTSESTRTAFRGARKDKSVDPGQVHW